MVGPTGLILAYWLYNPFDGRFWGDAGMPFSTNNWDPLAAIGRGATEAFPVLGEIPGGQGVENDGEFLGKRTSEQKGGSASRMLEPERLCVQEKAAQSL